MAVNFFFPAYIFLKIISNPDFSINFWEIIVIHFCSSAIWRPGKSSPTILSRGAVCFCNVTVEAAQFLKFFQHICVNIWNKKMLFFHHSLSGCSPIESWLRGQNPLYNLHMVSLPLCLAALRTKWYCFLFPNCILMRFFRAL